MMLPPELMPLFEGAYPSCIVTGSADGIPNIANLIRVWHMEPGCVAIANQLLNKTIGNLMENPLALLKIMNPQDFIHWEITVRYIHSVYEGPLFEQVRQELLTVSWVAGVPLPAALRSVPVFEIVSVRRCSEESFHLKPSPELYGDLLNVLAAAHKWNRLSYWIPGEHEQEVRLQASRGVAGAGVDSAAFAFMERLALLVRKERRVIRLKNIRSQLRYLHSIRHQPEESECLPPIPVTETTPASYLAFPITAYQSLIGIICCEAAGGRHEAALEAGDRYLALLAAKLGEILPLISTLAEQGQEREARFRQTVEYAKLQWEKESDPFHTALSARERQVAAHAAKGYTNAEIARQLFISPRTVTTHLERIYQKLDVPSRAALTRYILEKGLLAENPEHEE